MTAAWHFIQEWGTILAILAVAGAIAYGLTILRLPGAVPVAIGGIILAMGWYWHAEAIKTARSEIKADYEAKITKMIEVQKSELAIADKNNRADEQALLVQKKTLEENHAKKIEAANLVASAERRAANVLRVRIAEIAARAPQASASAGVIAASPPESGVGGVAASCVAEYQRLAEVARRAYEAGKLCEAEYDSVAAKINVTR